MNLKNATRSEILATIMEGVAGGSKALLIAPTSESRDGIFKECTISMEHSGSADFDEREIRLHGGGLLKMCLASEIRGLCNFTALVVMPGCEELDITRAYSTLRGVTTVDPCEWQVWRVLGNNDA